ncbi:MAG: hypothetical protein ACRCX2_00010 [Paraclostridium sp.]
MGNDLTTNNNEVLDFSVFKNEDLEVVGLDIDASDLKLPKVKLMQATSQEIAKSKGKILAGQFYNTQTQTSKDKIDCIILDQGKSMVMWKKPFKRGEEPLCRSFDGKVKAEGCGDGRCSTCQYSSQNPKAWDLAKQKGESKPACNMSYVFLAIDCETNMPFRIIVAGASVTNAKNFINKLAPLRISPFQAVVTLTTAQQENEQGIFYVTDFENIRVNTELITATGEVDKAKYKELSDTSKSYKELFMMNFAASDAVDMDSPASDEVVGEEGALF